MANGGQRVRVKVALLVAQGGKLRFEADSPLGRIAGDADVGRHAVLAARRARQSLP